MSDCHDDLIPTDELEIGNRLVDNMLDMIRTGCADCGESPGVEELTMGLLPDLDTLRAWHDCTGGCDPVEANEELIFCEGMTRYIQTMALQLAVALRRLAAL